MWRGRWRGGSQASPLDTRYHTPTNTANWCGPQQRKGKTSNSRKIIQMQTQTNKNKNNNVRVTRGGDGGGDEAVVERGFVGHDHEIACEVLHEVLQPCIFGLRCRGFRVRKLRLRISRSGRMGWGVGVSHDHEKACQVLHKVLQAWFWILGSIFEVERKVLQSYNATRQHRGRANVQHIRQSRPWLKPFSVRLHWRCALLARRRIDVWRGD